jgi:hypothetical protein
MSPADCARSAALLLTALGLMLAPRDGLAADPTVRDCLTASNSSVGLRSQHKLRETRAQLLVCVAASCPAEVREECARRMERLTAAIPTIVFEVKDGAGRELTAVTVTFDGEVVARELNGSALTLDPGSHTVTFEVAGEPPVTQTILFHEGDKDRHIPVVIGTVPVAPAAVAPLPSTATMSSDDGGHGRRVLGLAVGGAGVLGLGLGGLFAGLGFSSWSSANTACPSHNECSASAVSDRSSAVTFSTASDVAFVAGGVVLAAGAILYLTAPKGAAPTVGLSVTPSSVQMAGTF